VTENRIRLRRCEFDDPIWWTLIISSGTPDERTVVEW